MRNALLLVGLLAAALVGASVALGDAEAAYHLVVGWALFLARVLSRVEPDRNTLLAAVAAAVIFALGVYALGRRRLGLRGSAALTLLLFVLFAAAVAMVGVVHQAGWIASSPEPVRVTVVAPSRWGENDFLDMTLGLHNYNDAFGALPAGGTFSDDGQALHGWEFFILTFGPNISGMEIDQKLAWNHPRNARYFRTIIRTFINSELVGAPLTDGDGFGLNHYAANSHMFQANQRMRFQDIRDSSAMTIMLGEVNANFSPWGRPLNVRDPMKGVNKSPHGFGGPRGQGGAHFAMADGSVRFISDRVSPAVMKGLATPSGGDFADPAVLEAPRSRP